MSRRDEPPKVLPKAHTLVKAHGGLKASCKSEEIKATVVHRLNEIPNIRTDWRLSPEVTQLACSIVEAMVRKKNKGGSAHIDKKGVVLSALDQVFKCSDEEKAALDKQVEYICEQGLIEVISAGSVLCTCLSRYVLNHFLG